MEAWSEPSGMFLLGSSRDGMTVVTSRDTCGWMVTSRCENQSGWRYLSLYFTSKLDCRPPSACEESGEISETWASS